ncbi:YcnI family copper-binding membrane protein [Undibacterium flavidum]|uniref:YcnI family protein n=1 Tax=Undibacterium flavidum TaxID=2762297 RepID=A0ABR6Y7I7_9BURK|nr:YcnI family protein [Undibacterium flavidum]MBC3872109.1 YcnI family protein [Undibacterium flavidum]
MKKLLIPLCLLTFTSVTNAHVTLEQAKASAGSYHKLVFKVAHGCDGSATQSFKVTLPEQVTNAKPMPKAGWKLSIDRAYLSQAKTSHGKTITDDVREITWSGGELADAYYDEFTIQVKLGEVAEKLYFKVTQICEKARLDWIEIPSLGKSSKDLKFPAPMLEVENKTQETHQH